MCPGCDPGQRACFERADLPTYAAGFAAAEPQVPSPIRRCRARIANNCAVATGNCTRPSTSSRRPTCGRASSRRSAARCPATGTARATAGRMRAGCAPSSTNGSRRAPDARPRSCSARLATPARRRVVTSRGGAAAAAERQCRGRQGVPIRGVAIAVAARARACWGGQGAKRLARAVR